MNFDKICKNWATLGPIGYLPASGTLGTVPGLIFICLFNNFFSNFYLSIVLLFFITILTFVFISNALKYFYTGDPSQIVLDEFVGCLYTFFMIPMSYKTFILGFILFRLLDITKVFGIHKLEKYPGAFGILADDIAAGLISNAILNLLIYFSLL